MKKTGNGLLIWGILIFAFGLISLILSFPIRDGSEGMFFLSALLLVAGTIMIVFAIAKKKNINDINKDYLETYRNKALITTCFHCGHRIQCHAEDFREHRNFPEGFVYCPVCKKPLSFTAFDVYDDFNNFDTDRF